MPEVNDAPLLAFLHDDGSPLLFGELDPEYLRTAGIAPSMWERQFRVALTPQTSKRGNTFFSYEQGGLPLPSGLESEFELNGVRAMGAPPGVSQRGNPTRRYECALSIGGEPYAATGYVTITKSGCWVKFHIQVSKGQKVSGSTSGPIGGSYA